LDFKALDLLKRHYPEDNADIGTVYNSIAREYFSLKQYETALDYYRKTHGIYNKVYGEDDSDTAAVCGNISKTYVELREYNHALDWCLKALEAQKKVLGEEHPETILRHSFISEIYESLELYEEAIIHLLKIHDFYIKNNQDKIVRIVNERIADNYEKLNNHSEANKYRKMAAEAGERDE